MVAGVTTSMYATLEPQKISAYIHAPRSIKTPLLATGNAAEDISEHFLYPMAKKRAKTLLAQVLDQFLLL